MIEIISEYSIYPLGLVALVTTPALIRYLRGIPKRMRESQDVKIAAFIFANGASDRITIYNGTPGGTTSVYASIARLCARGVIERTDSARPTFKMAEGAEILLE
jgi:hypothetical protein